MPGGFVTANAMTAAEVGVEVLAVVPEPNDSEEDDADGTEDHVRTSLAVTVRGPEEAVASYIRSLGELPRLTVIQDVQLTAEGAGLVSAALGVVVFSQ